MYQLDDLLLFVSVFESRSFLKTSIQFGITQPTVSRRMKQLSEELGYEIFLNDGRHLSATEFGQMLYNVIKQKKMALDELKLSVNELLTNIKKNTGILRVLLPHAVSDIYITPFLAEFALEYPNINLQLTYNTEKVDFKEDKYDIAFIHYEPTQQTQKFAKILDFSINLYCTKEYASKYGLPSTLEEFSSHRYISMTWLGALLQKVEFVNMLTEQVEVFEPNNKIVISNHIQTLTFIRTNEFIGPVMDFLCRNQDSLIRVLPNYRINVSRSLYLMKNPYKDSSIMDIFTSFLRKKFLEISKLP